MKGIILAGGAGTRLMPLTKITNKHLLPIYNKPMIYYPLKTLVDAGIKDILIISSPDYLGQFINLLSSGKEFGVSISYKVQDEPGGIAQALGIAKNFVKREEVCVILGDNIFQDKIDISDYNGGARVFLKEVEDPHRFGVAEINENNEVLNIEEKPQVPKSNLAVTGLYIYDNEVFNIIDEIKPSARGELEITDVNNAYINKGKLKAKLLKGQWSDAGTFESLFKASQLIRNGRH